MKSVKKGKSKLGLYALLLIIIFIFLFNVLWMIRSISDRQIDDVNYFINCKNDSKYFDKSEILMVIPIYNNQSIGDFTSWCGEIKALNKTLAMHGVYHTYREFAEPRDESYVLDGMREFKKCFGYYPKYFEAPQAAMNPKNIKVIEGLNMTYLGYGFNLFHKVYHCSDTGIISNSIIDVF